MKECHSLLVKDSELFLDRLKLLSITSFELKQVADNPTAELTLKLNVVLNEAAGNLGGDLSQNLK